MKISNLEYYLSGLRMISVDFLCVSVIIRFAPKWFNADFWDGINFEDWLTEVNTEDSRIFEIEPVLILFKGVIDLIVPFTLTFLPIGSLVLITLVLK